MVNHGITLTDHMRYDYGAPERVYLTLNSLGISCEVPGLSEDVYNTASKAVAIFTMCGIKPIHS